VMRVIVATIAHSYLIAVAFVTEQGALVAQDMVK